MIALLLQFVKVLGGSEKKKGRMYNNRLTFSQMIPYNELDKEALQNIVGKEKMLPAFFSFPTMFLPM